MLGAEEYEPYNRVLLSEVVAGQLDVASITLPRSTHRAVQHRAARHARRSPSTAAPRVVHDHAGERAPVRRPRAGHRCARARIPELFGRRDDDDLPAGVHALRTLDDAREIVAATVNARRAVVVGGGVLGLEVAVRPRAPRGRT